MGDPTQRQHNHTCLILFCTEMEYKSQIYMKLLIMLFRILLTFVFTAIFYI